MLFNINFLSFILILISILNLLLLVKLTYLKQKIIVPLLFLLFTILGGFSFSLGISLFLFDTLLKENLLPFFLAYFISILYLYIKFLISKRKNQL